MFFFSRMVSWFQKQTKKIQALLRRPKKDADVQTRKNPRMPPVSGWKVHPRCVMMTIQPVCPKCHELGPLYNVVTAADQVPKWWEPTPWHKEEHTCPPPQWFLAGRQHPSIPLNMVEMGVSSKRPSSSYVNKEVQVKKMP